MTDPIEAMVRELCRRDPLPAREAGDERWTRETLAAILAEPRPQRRRGRGRRALRALPAVGLVAGLAGATALLLVAAPERNADETAPAVPAGSRPAIGALDRRAHSGDPLPAWVLADPIVRNAGVVPRSSRLMERRAGRLLYGARALQRERPPRAPTRQVCLMDVIARAPGPDFRPGRPGRIACVSEQRMEDGFLMMAVRTAGAQRRVGLIGLVPDGFATVRTGSRAARVDGNLFRVSHVLPWLPVEIDGVAGRRVDWTGEIPPQPMLSDDARPLPVALFRTPPVPYDELPPRIQRAVDDEPGRRAWRAAAADGMTYWLLTDGRPGSRVLRIGDGIGGGRGPTVDYPLVWGLSSQYRPGEPAAYRFSALVGDGYTRLSVNGPAVAVRRNFVVLTGTAGREPLGFVLTGPSGRFEFQVSVQGQDTRLLKPVAP